MLKFRSICCLVQKASKTFAQPSVAFLAIAFPGIDSIESASTSASVFTRKRLSALSVDMTGNFPKPKREDKRMNIDKNFYHSEDLQGSWAAALFDLVFHVKVATNRNTGHA